MTNIFSNDIFDDYDLSYATLLYTEYEQMEVDETSNLSSWFHKLNANYSATDDIYLSLGAKGNIVLSETPYDKLSNNLTNKRKKKLSKIDMSDASINYDNNLVSVHLGRIDLNYDWLCGSIDGALLSIGDDKTTSLRLLWFDTFTQQNYNSYFKIDNINASNGLYGTIFKTKKSNFEVTLYDYFMQDLRNTLGAHLNYGTKVFGINLIYTDTRALSLATYTYDESLAQVSLEYIYKHNYIEMGGSYTGKNGLLAMTQMGSNIIGEFYLTNQINREDAKNIYMKYIYLSNNWYFKFLAGVTKYDNSFISLEKNLQSFEIDAYYRYDFNKKWFVNLGVMSMEVQKQDPISFSKLSTIVILGYKYELF